MGLDDRDYMRKRPLRWDERSGEMRLDDGEPARGGLSSRRRFDWRVMLAIAVAVVGLTGAGYWMSRNALPVASVAGGPPGPGPVEQVPAAPAQPKTAPAATGDCNIKGNIGSSGKIYHVLGSSSYDRTQIDESNGERWFCSEEEAKAAGWRPPRG